MPAPAILLFVRAPRPGAAKTRLTPFLSPRAAAEVAACLARDAYHCARRCLPPGGRLVIACTPDDGWEYLAKALGVGESAADAMPPLVVRQRGEHLGKRMENAVYDATFDHDCGPLVLLGADCPLLPSAAIRTAFRLLSGDRDDGDKSADVVLGPAEDGGYYLLGLRGPDRMMSLLGGVAWGTDTVFSQTAANAQRLRLWVSADLPVCYDIDRPSDLVRLRDDIESDPELRQTAPAIADWLQRNTLPPLTALVGDGHR